MYYISIRITCTLYESSYLMATVYITHILYEIHGISPLMNGRYVWVLRVVKFCASCWLQLFNSNSNWLYFTWFIFFKYAEVEKRSKKGSKTEYISNRRWLAQRWVVVLLLNEILHSCCTIFPIIGNIFASDFIF